MKKNNETYFAADDAKSCVRHLTRKADGWYGYLQNNRLMDVIIKSWEYYHGQYNDKAHDINFGGETGELALIAINHYRNIAKHINNMVTATRPSFQARAVNTDSKSQVQTKLANGLLDYYMRDKKMEIYLRKAVEYAIVLGAGYILMEWNATSGEVYDVIDPTPEFDENVILERDENGDLILNENGEYLTIDQTWVSPLTNDEGNLVSKDGRVLEPYRIYEGDVEFTNLSPLDVVFDSTKESNEQHKWCLVRTFKNKYDIAKKYPEYEKEILGIQSKDSMNGYKMSFTPYDETDDIPVYELFHKETESVPDGRYIMYLNESIILMDSPMPYKVLPVFRISAGDIIGTPYAYTPMFDLIPIQTAVNASHSIILTNHTAFGVQNIANPRGNDVKYTQLAGGLNFIEYDTVPGAPQGGMPTPLNLTQTPSEIFKYLEQLVHDMETISGVNSVARGNPEASLNSGNALALVQSQALQFMSDLQQSYILLIESVGTGLIKLLQQFAKVPRVAEITGLSNHNKIIQFSSEKIDQINRVVVDVGNPLSHIHAGRVQMADNLLQKGLITTPEMYFSVVNSGNLESMTDLFVDENILITDENENLVSGEMEVIALITDNHDLHIKMHKSVLNTTQARQDPNLVARTLAHINEHIELSRTQPELLAFLGEQSLGPVGGSPPAPMGQEIPPQSGEIPPDLMNAGGTQAGPNATLPQPAQAPQVDSMGNPTMPIPLSS